MDYSIRVKVNGQSVCMRSTDMRHQFTLADLKAACDEYQIPYERAKFKRNGAVLGGESVIANGDFITLDFPKGGEG